MILQFSSIELLDNEGNLVNTNVANAIKYAVEVDGMKVFSISLGSYRGGTSEIAEALKVAANYGTTVVAAAGNCSGITDESESCPISYPASDSSVVSVGATDKDEHHAIFAAKGERVDI
jgi:hypothetical protein